ncbi:ficolin-2-like [Mytilus californianus]|uniref:ficolin-2-like n=1 Tax=Mytilus californianus TaxID=6549 RepID=UPI00224635F2|nr:ficolin-2-like [Mytilus californianus]
MCALPIAVVLPHNDARENFVKEAQPLPPKVRIPQSSYDGIFGQSVHLICIVTSQLPLTGVTWKKHDGGSVSTIDPDDSGSFYRDGDVESPSLITLNVIQNTGTYVCSASNKVDTRSGDTITLVHRNDFLHYITSSGQYRLYVELEAYDGSTAYAKYATFSISDLQSDYILNFSGYSGNADDSLHNKNGMKFSTLDRENDKASCDCALASQGAWWYSACYSSNLNGRYGIGNDTKGIVWRGFKEFNSLKASKMMVKIYY